MKAINMNMAANLLGLGNAATPLGLAAMKELDRQTRRPGTASTAGCSDSAFTTSMGIPTLCAVGVLGEGQHSPHEHALEGSLLTQAKRLTAAILSMPDDF